MLVSQLVFEHLWDLLRTLFFGGEEKRSKIEQNELPLK